MNYIVRLIGSLIKSFIYLCVIFIAIGAALFWFDTGSWLVQPIAQRAGNFFLAPLKLELANVNGSLRNGYSLDGLRLISGDEDLFSLNHASVSPDWDLVLQGMNGIPYIKHLDLQGVSSDLNKVLALVDHFTTSSDTKETSNNDNNNETSAFILNPFNLSVRDVNFGTEYANLSLDALTLDEAGNLLLNTKIISRDNVLPFKANARMNFDPIEIISSDIFIGQKSTGSFKGTFAPVKARLDLTALSLDELLKFAPPMDIKASGRIDGRVFLDTDSNNIMTASGVVSMPRANVMDIPLNFRLPFRWNGNNFVALDNATLNTSAAGLRLNASADINKLNVQAKGEAQNISLNEIGRMFAPQAGLKGEGGWLNFDVDTVLSGDILGNTMADINAKMPMLETAGIRVLNDLNAHVKLVPKEAPKVSLGGEVFRGKLFARGEAMQDEDGNIKPQAIVSIVNMDLSTLGRAIPAMASSKPSGRVSATARISENMNVEGKITSDKLGISGVTLNNLLANLDYNNQNSSVVGKITSDKLNTNGITLANLLANLNYNIQDNRAVLDEFRANLGRGLIAASGNANIKDSTFNAKLDARNIDTKALPALKDLTGNYNLTASASGKYTDMNTITANANLEARNMVYAGTPIGNITLPVTYANSRVNIPRATASITGGVLNVQGNADIRNMANPTLNFTASTNGINLANIFRDFKLETPSMPVSGRLRGNASIRGPLNTANMTANIYADNVRAGRVVNMPAGALEVYGNMKRLNIRTLDATINNARLMGRGNISINQKDIMNSTMNLGASLRRFDIKQTLAAAGIEAPVSGIINASATLKGTMTKPELDAKVNSITINNEMFFDDIDVKLRTPEANHYLISAATTFDTFRPEVDIDAKKTGDIWEYQVDSRPLDINTVLESRVPAMAGIVKGLVTVSVAGSTKENSPIGLTAAANELNVIDKIKIQDISLPITYNPSSKTVNMRNGMAFISDGIITLGANVDIDKTSWNGDVEVKHLDLGKLAAPFMPEGELIGSVDMDMNMRGGFGVMPLSFAEGKFETTPGYLHKIELLDKITPTKRISFEEINGTFFWNGTDLFINPGTGAKADRDEPLYRYFNINGSAGIPGKGLKLDCEGRFDLKILDQLLGAMKGVFQYMTGTIAQSVLRDAAGRVLGIKRRDYQNVSFTLANSWQELQLLDLKITKSIEDFLPINILNKDQEKQREETQFKMSLKIPTGPGDKSIEEESPQDQFKQQLIDNLFNIGL